MEYEEQRLQDMVYQEMKDWAEARRIWNRDVVPFDRVVSMYAEYCGWKQQGFNEMDIVE